MGEGHFLSASCLFSVVSEFFFLGCFDGLCLTLEVFLTYPVVIGCLFIFKREALEGRLEVQG